MPSRITTYVIVLGALVAFFSFLVNCGSLYQDDPRFCDENQMCPAGMLCDTDGSNPASDGVANTCVPAGDGGVVSECEVDEDCADQAGKPFCDTREGLNKCVRCVEDKHCQGDASGPTCLSGATPADASCGCTDHSDCPVSSGSSGICNSVCATQAEVVYVAKGGGTDEQCGLNGPNSNPCAAIQKGIDQLAIKADRLWIYVAAADADGYEEPLTIRSGKKLHLVGDVSGEGVIVKPGTVNQPALTVESGADAIVERITLRDATGTGVGVECDSATLVLRRMTIRRNEGGGVQITNSTITMLNNIIDDNGSAGSEFGGIRVKVTGTTTGDLQFNTIVGNKNGDDTIAPGVNCAQAGQLMASSNIVQSNILRLAQKTQVQGCTWKFSALTVDDGPVGVGNNISNTCALTAERRLIPDNNPCVDAGEPTTSVVRDIDGEDRPRGSAPDIGADELE